MCSLPQRSQQMGSLAQQELFAIGRPAGLTTSSTLETCFDAPPAPLTSILIVPLGPRFVFITSSRPLAALMFMNRAACRPMTSALAFNDCTPAILLSLAVRSNERRRDQLRLLTSERSEDAPNMQTLKADIHSVSDCYGYECYPAMIHDVTAYAGTGATRTNRRACVATRSVKRHS
jgi:hypothetical protein